MKAGAPERPDILQELERILSSPGFTRNERLSRFLRFLVERHLDGRDDELKESLIGLEVFGRKADYDPKLDPIVRTEAGRLRSRLVEYYAAEGLSDPVVIEVPKGGYLPRFRQVGEERVEPNPRGNRFALAAAVAVVTMVVGAAAWWSFRGTDVPVRIAVLPLENLSADPASDYFADGLTDEIISKLSVIERLVVRSRTSSFVFKGQPPNVREAGKQLDVEYILEGSVARDAERVRINTQLVRVRDDIPVWSAKFDRALTDVLAVQDEISLGIVNSLRLQLGGGRRRYETSVEAYDLYLRARADSRQNPLAAFQSLELFEQAIAKDSAFAPAYAGLASSYAVRSIQFQLDHPEDELSKMRAAAEKAIQLDPLLAEAHAALGMTYARQARWPEAEESFRHAIALDPNRSMTYDDFGLWLLAALGRYEEALQQLRLAEKADPLSRTIQFHLGMTLVSAQQYEEATAVCQKLPENFPNVHQCLARAWLGRGNPAKAAELLERSPNLSANPQARGFLGYSYAKSGRLEEAERLAAASRYPDEQALIFAGLGNKDRTLEALGRMSVVGAQRIGLYLNRPEFALLRGDQREEALRQRVGLPR